MSDLRRSLAAVKEQAAADVARYRSDRTALGALGHFTDAGVRSLLLRRLLLAVPLPLSLLAAASERGGARAAAFVQEVAYWRAVRRLLPRHEWAALTHGPVILMYHAIGAAGEPASRYLLPERSFRRQMQWLQRRGYPLVPLSELARARLDGRPLPPAAVAVTFDDGYRDNAAALAATPVPATIFVVTGEVGKSNGWDAGGPLAGRPLLSWDDARRLEQAGMEIGGHTRTHPQLPQAPGERLCDELGGSLEDLRRELGRGDRTFAYPHGRYDARVQEALAQSGYLCGCCSLSGVNDPGISRWELRRLEIKGTASFAGFALSVWLGRRVTLREFVRSLFVG